MKNYLFILVVMFQTVALYGQNFDRLCYQYLYDHEPNVYYFCYEQGYLAIDNDYFALVKRDIGKN